VTEPVLERAFWYWMNVDIDLGDRVKKGVQDLRSVPEPRRPAAAPEPAHSNRGGSWAR
jgi:hypothetical protein